MLWISSSFVQNFTHDGTVTLAQHQCIRCRWIRKGRLIKRYLSSAMLEPPHNLYQVEGQMAAAMLAPLRNLQWFVVAFAQGDWKVLQYKMKNRAYVLGKNVWCHSRLTISSSTLDPAMPATDASSDAGRLSRQFVPDVILRRALGERKKYLHILAKCLPQTLQNGTSAIQSPLFQHIFSVKVAR